MSNVAVSSSEAIGEGRIRHEVCVACGAPESPAYLTCKSRVISRCPTCGLQWQNPQPTDAELAKIYGTYYFIGSDDGESRARKLRIKQATAQLYLEMIKHYLSPVREASCAKGTLLEVGSGQGEFLCEALSQGYSVTGVEYSAEACSAARSSLVAIDPSGARFSVKQGALEEVTLDAGSFDLCVMNDVIEHVREPQKTLARARELLRPGGVLFIATPSLDSWSARLMGKLWMEYKEEHLFFFSNSSLKRALEGAGFANVALRPGYKVLTLEYIAQHFEKFPVPGFSPLVKVAVGLLPRSLARRPIRVVASGVIALATAR
jgi:SAM-dependent methyltransferase